MTDNVTATLESAVNPLDPPYADIPDLLARAHELLRRHLEPSPPPSAPESWILDAARWRDDYLAALPALQRPHGAVFTVVEEIRPGADPNDGPAVVVPNRIEINGMPLLVTERGPIVEKIDTKVGSATYAAVTLTAFARRVTIDARLPEVAAAN